MLYPSPIFLIASTIDLPDDRSICSNSKHPGTTCGLSAAMKMHYQMHRVLCRVSSVSSAKSGGAAEHLRSNGMYLLFTAVLYSTCTSSSIMTIVHLVAFIWIPRFAFGAGYQQDRVIGGQTPVRYGDPNARRDLVLYALACGVRSEHEA